MTEKNDLIAWAIDLRERFPHWPYKKPKPGHEGGWTSAQLPPHDSGRI